MTPAWEFEHSVTCQADRDFAWRFWTDVNNWAAVDSSVESVKLDGPFATGTKGTTKPRDMEPVEWHLLEVSDGTSAVIEVPAPGAAMRCFWQFEDLPDGGIRITERVNLVGEKAGEYVEMFAPQLESGIPQVMQKLVNAIQKAAGGRE